MQKLQENIHRNRTDKQNKNCTADQLKNRVAERLVTHPLEQVNLFIGHHSVLANDLLAPLNGNDNGKDRACRLFPKSQCLHFLIANIRFNEQGECVHHQMRLESLIDDLIPIQPGSERVKQGIGGHDRLNSQGLRRYMPSHGNGIGKQELVVTLFFDCLNLTMRIETRFQNLMTGLLECLQQKELVL
ncbi:hypothetical protein SDC9_67414 [bioreactor metagenome]|uniref:Uncharacterized protein n=1 Tax=bioreactor metagenome TaxID=1076179 RepID=A0A644XXQ6_9ZZZZ